MFIKSDAQFRDNNGLEGSRPITMPAAPDTSERTRGLGDPAAITAAIIGAVMAAATTATASLQQALSSTGSAVVQGGVLLNESPRRLGLWAAFIPNHGMWTKSPPFDVPAFPSPQQAFDVWKGSGFAPSTVESKQSVDELTAVEVQMLCGWIEATFRPEVETIGLNSMGAGVEGVVIYSPSGAPDVALYLDNPKIGTIQAGALVATRKKMNELVKNGGSYGTNIISLIRDGSSETGSFSTCHSWGHTTSCKLDGLEIKLTAARETLFRFSEVG